MAELIPFTEEQISEMRQMRRAGATLREIARHFRTSATTVLSYVRGVQAASDGQEVEYTPLDFVYDWAPALPDEGLPRRADWAGGANIAGWAWGGRRCSGCAR